MIYCLDRDFYFFNHILSKANIPFQIVPGITAASGCASYAGIPLTHRDHAQSVRFLTGHLKDNTLNLDWANLIQEQETLVFYMGLLGIKTICEQLIDHGMDAEMPIAVVQQGTTKTQRVVTADLKTKPAVVDTEKLKAPTIIIIGRVVGLRNSLDWYCLLYTSPSPRDRQKSRMPSSA